jgi:hypothetical protein
MNEEKKTYGTICPQKWELETWKERQTKWIENGYKPEEKEDILQQIKELCERHVCNKTKSFTPAWTSGFNNALERVLKIINKEAD